MYFIHNKLGTFSARMRKSTSTMILRAVNGISILAVLNDVHVPPITCSTVLVCLSIYVFSPNSSEYALYCPRDMTDLLLPHLVGRIPSKELVTGTFRHVCMVSLYDFFVSLMVMTWSKEVSLSAFYTFSRSTMARYEMSMYSRESISESPSVQSALRSSMSSALSALRAHRLAI